MSRHSKGLIKRRPESASQPTVSASNSVSNLKHTILKHRASASYKTIDSKHKKQSNSFCDKKKLEVSECSSFAACQMAFLSIIKKDRLYGTALEYIKVAYDKHIQSQSEMIYLINEKLENTLKDYKVLENRLEKISRENVELSRLLDNKEQNLLNFKHNIDKSSEFKKECNKVCKSLDKENKELRTKERQLLKLIVCLKHKGIPVENIFNNEVLKKKDSPISDDTENENLVEGPPLSVQKPTFVPPLDMNNLHF